MEFRKASCSEIDRVMDILSDGRSAIGQLGIDQWQSGYPHRDIVAEDVAQGESYVVLDDDGELIATAMVSFRGESSYDFIDGSWLTSCSSRDPHYCVVHRVAVSSSSTRGGMGRFILSNAERLAAQQGAKSVRIDTHPGNVPMRSLVSSSGYIECGIIRIPHCEDGIPERIAFEKLL